MTLDALRRYIPAVSVVDESSAEVVGQPELLPESAPADPSIPGENNDICVKCKFFAQCENPFLDGVYISGSGRMCEGVPPEADRPDGGWIAVIGEPPDTFGDEKGSTWSANATNRLFHMLRDDLDEHRRIWYHPITKCRPLVKSKEKAPDGAYPAKEAQMTVNQYKRCWNAFVLPNLLKLKPRAIIATSGQACKMLADSADIMSMVGKRYTTVLPYEEGLKEVSVYPIWPTDYVVQDRDLRRPRWVEQARKVFERIENPVTYSFVEKEGWMEYLSGVTPEIVEGYFRSSMEKDRDAPMCWDVETMGVEHVWLDSSRVGVFSFHHPAHELPMIVVNEDYKYAEQVYAEQAKGDPRGWRDLSRQNMEVVRRMLEDPKVRKLGHNTQYDETAVYSRFGWNVEGFFADTIMLAYILNSDDPGGRTLNELVRTELPGVPDYWKHTEKFHEENPELEYNYVLYPPHVMLPYAAYDTKTVTHIFDAMVNRFAAAMDEGVGGWFVRSTDPPANKTYSLFDYAFRARRFHYLLCIHLEKTGQHVDTELLGQVSRVYMEEQEQLKAKLAAFPEVQQFEWQMLRNCFSDNSAEKRKIKLMLGDAAAQIGTIVGVKPEEVDWDNLSIYTGNAEHGGAVQEVLNTAARPRINWNSPPQVKRFFYDFLGMDVPHRTDTDEPSTDRAALINLSTRQNCKIAKELLEFRGVEKFLSSFIHPMNAESAIDRTIKKDGLVHSNFHPNRTRTGRLSSSQPNMQQVPRDGLVKKLYASRFKNGWIIQRDYSGLEVRVLACLSQDAKLVDDFNNGRDPHFRTQRYFFGEGADKHNKSQRSICKQVLFGRIYGQGTHGLFELLRSRQVASPFTGGEITLDECDRLNTMIDQLYPGVAEWVSWAHAQAGSEAWVCSPFGFVRPLPAMESYEYYLREKKAKNDSKAFGFLSSEINGCLRKAQNTPIQSAASDLTVFAGWQSLKKIEEAGLRSKLYLLVHDSIWVDCIDDDEVEPVCEILNDVMDRADEWLPELLPGYDPSWMCVPIIGECEMGLHAKDALVASEEPTRFNKDKRLVLDIPQDWMPSYDAERLRDTERTDFDDGGGFYHAPFRENADVIRKMLLAKRRAL